MDPQRNSLSALDTETHHLAMIRFEDLLGKVRAYSPEADLELLRKAYVFSALAHKGQVRHSGEPYLVHPLEVSDILADQRLDVVCVAAGLLHDVVEDTLTTVERIQELFGTDVAHIVEGVTKISAIPFSSSEERQAENFRKMLLAMVDDIRVIFVKLADRLHNMRTLQFMPEDRRARVAQETLDIYAPIANRLGMNKVKNELEELAFLHLEPTAYQSLKARVDAKRATTEGVIEELTSEIRAEAGGGRGAGRDRRRPRQAPLQHLAQAQAPEDRARPGLRLRRHPHRHAVGEGLLRRARHHPPGVVAGARAHQGLHRHAAAQRLPVAAHLGDLGSRRALRGADPHRGDAPARRGRDRGALEVQGRPRRRRPRRAVLPVDAPAARDASGGARLAGVPEPPEDRPLSRGGLRLHAARPGEGAARRGHADRLRLRRAHRRRPPLRGRPRERPHGAAALEAQERRHRRDHEHRRPRAQPRLAELREDLARAQQDQAVHPDRGERPRHRRRPEAAREGSQALRHRQGDARGREPAARRHRARHRQGGRPAGAGRLRQAVGAPGARRAGARRAAEGEGARPPGGVGGEARAAARRAPPPIASP